MCYKTWSCTMNGRPLIAAARSVWIVAICRTIFRLACMVCSDIRHSIEYSLFPA
ncbi:t22.4 [Tupaiid betaherpesvirus 1]|uniref:T22.4 n=1 Tax=Tupaiid herpesvirus 1 (strain 1) TaxID=10397 RepID=Q91TT5_TUHV1|nr:t22.4 [Tupaiid betaherpesvirus 1]AAK57052.1 t22.4 [Tupaiid betaherpesvirus 1]